jgi:hypothetical protein
VKRRQRLDTKIKAGGPQQAVNLDLRRFANREIDVGGAGALIQDSMKKRIQLCPSHNRPLQVEKNQPEGAKIAKAPENILG